MKDRIILGIILFISLIINTLSISKNIVSRETCEFLNESNILFTNDSEKGKFFNRTHDFWVRVPEVSVRAAKILSMAGGKSKDPFSDPGNKDLPITFRRTAEQFHPKSINIALTILSTDPDLFVWENFMGRFASGKTRFTVLAALKSDTFKAKINPYIKLAIAYLEGEKKYDADRLFGESITIQKLEAMLAWSVICYFRGEKEKAVRVCEKVIEKASAIGDRWGVIESAIQLGQFQRGINKTEEAWKAMELAKKELSGVYIPFLSHRMSFLHGVLTLDDRNLDDAQRHFLDVVSRVGPETDTMVSAASMINLGLIEDDQGLLENALRWYSKAEYFFTRSKDYFSVNMVLINEGGGSRENESV